MKPTTPEMTEVSKPIRNPPRAIINAIAAIFIKIFRVIEQA
jgi:hypothetical protein